MKTKLYPHQFLKALVITGFSITSMHAFSQNNSLPATGNVGIGTTQPDQKLTVRGSARIDSTLLVKDSIIVNKNATIKNDLRVVGSTLIKNDLKVAGNTTLIGNTVIRDGDFKIKTLGDTTLSGDGILMINANGKVKNGGDLKSLVYAEDAAVDLIHCKSDLNGGTIYSAPYWQAHGMPNPSMYLINTACSPDPRLGVGVKPTAKMHVQLNIGSNIHPLLIEKRLSNNPNSPQQSTKLMQLDHTGLLFAREIKVNLDSWPDYVFEKNYPLMPLDELHDFIKENNHLPNVPSACEMEAEGINVAKSNVMLMEKVEELTLYVLQINEQLQQQQETIRLQQELIKKLEQQVNVNESR